MRRCVNLLVLVLFVTCLGCAALQPAANALLQPSDPTNPTGPTVLDEKIRTGTEGTPYAKYATNIGAGLSVLLAFLAYQKAGKAERAATKA